MTVAARALSVAPTRAVRERRRPWFLVAPALALVVVFFVLPYANLLVMSFFMPGKAEPYDAIPTLSNYTSALGDSFQWWILWRTLKLGFLTTLFTLVVGYPLAYNLARAGSKVKGMLLVLLLSPLLVGVVVRSFGWMVLLADNGLINSIVKHWGLAPHGLKLITTPLLVVQTAVDVHNWPGAAAHAVILFATSLACIGLYFKLMNRAMRGLSA